MLLHYLPIGKLDETHLVDESTLTTAGGADDPADVELLHSSSCFFKGSGATVTDKR